MFSDEIRSSFSQIYFKKGLFLRLSLEEFKKKIYIYLHLDLFKYLNRSWNHFVSDISDENNKGYSNINLYFSSPKIKNNDLKAFI